MVFKDMKLMHMVKELVNLIIQMDKHGKTIQLTIDTEIQKLCNKLLKRC